MKPLLKVAKIRNRKDGSCDVSIDTNAEGRRLLMEAGFVKVLQDFIGNESHKISFIDKLKICWNILK